MVFGFRPKAASRIASDHLNPLQTKRLTCRTQGETKAMLKPISGLTFTAFASLSAATLSSDRSQSSPKPIVVSYTTNQPLFISSLLVSQTTIGNESAANYFDCDALKSIAETNSSEFKRQIQDGDIDFCKTAAMRGNSLFSNIERQTLNARPRKQRLREGKEEYASHSTVLYLTSCREQQTLQIT